MIEDFSLTCTEIQYNKLMILEAMLSFLTCKHSDHEDLCKYTNVPTFDHVTRFLGATGGVAHAEEGQ